MRTASRWLLAAAFTSILIGSTWAQAPQQETLWQRFKGVITGKAAKAAPRSEMRPLASDAKRSAPTGPNETRGVVYIEEPKTSPLPKTPPRAMPSAAPAVKQAPAAAPPTTRTPPAAKNDVLIQGLTRQVSQKCPQARNVKLAFTGAKEVTVEMEVRTQEEANTLVEHVFAIRDLDPYRVNVKFIVPQN